jgi:hypothetical protein
VSLNRYAKKRDASEPEIVSALLQCGFSVERLDRPVDLAVGFRGRCWLVECKVEGAKLNKNQQEFVAAWRGPKVVVLRSAQDAIDWASDVAAETERAA